MKFLFRAALLGSLGSAGLALAQTAAPAAPGITTPDASGIGAVVNGQVITTQDVAARARLLAVTMGMNPTPGAIARLTPQVTKQLIDQTLEQQEINKLGVTVPDADVATAIGHIEQNNNMPAGALRQHLAALGVPFSTLLMQIRTELGWQAVLHKVLGPGLAPTPGDMTAQKAALTAQLGSTQYHLAEIFVPVTDPVDDAPAKAFANTVITQLRAGAPFPIVAAQFSQAQTALSGGDLGYVQVNQMDPSVANTVRNMPVGAISDPIRVPGGYDIVQLLDKHDIGNEPQTVLSIRQVFAPYPSAITNGSVGPAQAAVINKLAAQSKNLTSCDAVSALNAQYGNAHPADPGPVALATVTPASFQALLGSLPLDHISEPLVQQDGVSVIMVCSRAQQAAALPPDSDIANMIINRRVELESEQLLDILRHRAVITESNQANVP
ncbi:peptidylprolyl isomerase [Acidocella sp.]|uniref:peptidylprolyl isomerase n=1 Tax=Acidocella sp. TaxID=50710 RepID=UPI00261E29B1|nr:peptidylprolyl isomerase [Acidocella sp.]